MSDNNYIEVNGFSYSVYYSSDIIHSDLKDLKNSPVVGYHEDAIPGIILELSQNEGYRYNPEQMEKEVKQILLRNATPDGVMRVTKTEIASEAAELFSSYFVDQSHDSLAAYIRDTHSAEETLLVQVTTHSRLLTSAGKKEMTQILGMRETALTLLSLQQFKTEEEFRRKIQIFFDQNRPF